MPWQLIVPVPQCGQSVVPGVAARSVDGAGARPGLAGGSGDAAPDPADPFVDASGATSVGGRSVVGIHVDCPYWHV